MSRELKGEEIEYISVAGNGACLFNSVAQNIHLENSTKSVDRKRYTYKLNMKEIDKSSMDLRQKTVEWLKSNLDIPIPPTDMTIKQDIQDDIENGSLPKSVKSVNSYFNYMRKKSSYGGQVEICALSHILNRNINVYKSYGNNYTTAGLGYTINPNNRDNDILLFHNMNEVAEDGAHHYDLLYPISRGIVVSKLQYKKIDDKNSKKTKKSTRKSSSSVKSILSESSSSKSESIPSELSDKSKSSSLPSNIDSSSIEEFEYSSDNLPSEIDTSDSSSKKVLSKSSSDKLDEEELSSDKSSISDKSNKSNKSNKSSNISSNKSNKSSNKSNKSSNKSSIKSNYSLRSKTKKSSSSSKEEIKNDCKSYKKSKPPPGCDNLDGCRWIPKVGCVEDDEEAIRKEKERMGVVDKPSPVKPNPIKPSPKKVSKKKEKAQKHVCRTYRKSKPPPGCEGFDGCRWIPKVGCVEDDEEAIRKEKERMGVVDKPSPVKPNPIKPSPKKVSKKKEKAQKHVCRTYRKSKPPPGCEGFDGCRWIPKVGCVEDDEEAIRKEKERMGVN